MQQGLLVVGCIVLAMAGLYSYYLVYVDAAEHDSSVFHLLSWVWEGVYYGLFEFEHRFKWLILALIAVGWLAVLWMISLLTGTALPIPTKVPR